MDETDKGYYLQRARDERARADAATCIEAARAHRDLARYYSARLEAAGPTYVSLADEQVRHHDGTGTYRPTRSLQIPLLRN
jgi:hypothetical protein